MRNLKVLLLSVLISSSFLSLCENTFHTANPVELTESQKAFLQEDSPLREIRFFANETLWILGQKFLWRYHIESKELEQVNFHSSPLPSFEIEALLTHKNSLYLASDEKLFQIVDTGSLSFFSYESLAEESSITNSLQRDPLGFIHWITSDGVQTIDPLTKQTIDFRKAVFPEEKFLYFLKGFTCFEIEGPKLYKKSLKEDKREIIFEAEEELSSLKQAGPFLYLFEKKKLHLLEMSGEEIQTLLIEKEKKLYKSKISDEFDAYFFLDQTLEFHNKVKKTSKHYKIPLIKREKLLSFDTTKNYFATFSQREIFIFKLEDKL